MKKSCTYFPVSHGNTVKEVSEFKQNVIQMIFLPITIKIKFISERRKPLFVAIY